ncbi:MAG: B12-binding domain-containing radical SAM protein [Ferruginibacter sp.]
MNAQVFLITPPFTQLNTPYPATAYLKGFLNTQNISSVQADLGIEVTLALFCTAGLRNVFAAAPAAPSENAARIFQLRKTYIALIDSVVNFLQGKDLMLAHRICNRTFLPEASRFAQLGDVDWAFGSMGIQDKAKHLATMFIEDLADYITECVDGHFGISRYAEQLGRSANSFDELYEALHQPNTFIDDLLIKILADRMVTMQPILVAISVPFPGNLYAALRCGQWLKRQHPAVKVAMGGGFANTELRSLSDPRVFEFFDFVTLDDGEAPLLALINYITGNASADNLKRTFLLQNGVVKYINVQNIKDYRQGEVGTPDYSDFLLHDYISAIEVINPMHRMWSDGRWNKLTMAHGCYWGKCTFCDVSLDYIKLYEPVNATLICDRIEIIIAQTGQSGFHFVDEAAPPALMRALAMEIIKRKLVITWWTNVRFEKSFTRDLCLLLKASGCIAVSGGLEVASDRLLQLIQKGINVAQVARVNKNFTEAGIMIHAYLMYGFPTQTTQETVDSLEMVRQMFSNGILQSAFWHRFALTAHSPVGLEPEKYNLQITNPMIGSFANNDVDYEELSGTDHGAFSFGLKKSLLNFMHKLGMEEPLQKWFELKIPKTNIDANYIARVLGEPDLREHQSNAKVVWLGQLASVASYVQSKKGNSRQMLTLCFVTSSGDLCIDVEKEKGDWLIEILPTLSQRAAMPVTLQQVKTNYEKAGLEDFELFWDNKPLNTLYKAGLLQV